MSVAAANPEGVMTAAYARERASNPALAFRLRARARIVVEAVRQFHGARRLHGAKALRLLEVGAAEGRTLIEMAKQLGGEPTPSGSVPTATGSEPVMPGCEFVGVEYDHELRGRHPSLPPSVRLMAGDASDLPAELGGGRFDVVSLLAVLEHLPDPVAALREAHRVLKPGGLLVATCPNPFWDRIAGTLRMVDQSCHVTTIDLDRLGALTCEAGFRNLQTRPFMWAPVAVLPYLRIPVAPGIARFVDSIVARVPGVRWLCVNAFVVARKDARKNGGGDTRRSAADTRPL